MKKVLVTGASGYLGGKLCVALHRQSYYIKVLVRHTSDLSVFPPPSEIFYGDIIDFPSLLAAVSSCSAVFYLAALVEPWLPDLSTIFSVVHVLRHQWEYSCEKAKRELDYNPRSLSDGLAEVLLC